jgi:checkpoint serine/threonine-protein kinase
MNKRMDEPLIIYYTLEMLKIVEILHGAGIIHGDIKPDNFLIKNNPGQELDDWGSGSPGTSGHAQSRRQKLLFLIPPLPLFRTTQGWDSKGLMLIDYGRSIDTRLYSEGTVFKSGNHVEGFKYVLHFDHTTERSRIAMIP